MVSKGERESTEVKRQAKHCDFSNTLRSQQKYPLNSKKYKILLKGASDKDLMGKGTP